MDCFSSTNSGFFSSLVSTISIFCVCAVGVIGVCGGERVYEYKGRGETEYECRILGIGKSKGFGINF